jgi:CubicO group peptidase (beta-lactamase class C family)
VPLRFGIGFGLSSETMPMGPRTCAWGGYGGSLVVNDLDANVTVAYVMNRMEPGLLGDPRGASIVIAAVMSLAAA